MMLITICGVVLAAILLVYAFWTRTNWLKSFVLGGVVIWFASYAILLFANSIFSRERNLGLNESKEFCGFYFDCHLHAAVTGIRKTKTLGDKISNGDFYIVKVKVFSDAQQTTLGLITVDAEVVDEQNNSFPRDTEAEAELGEQPAFEKRISPVENFEKEIVFDLPADVKNPRLDIKEGYGIDHAIEAVLIDDEDSLLHKRNYFKIESNDQTASNN